MPKIPFKKPIVALQDQSKLMESRGLYIGNHQAAQAFLTYTGYYRISGYTHYYLDPNDPGGERFRAGTTLSDIVDLYDFDRKLRSLFGRALQKIEIAAKAVVSHEGAMFDDPFWLCNPSNFDAGSHSIILDMIDSAIGDEREENKEVFIRHFYTKYYGDYPPCWMTMEVLSFGQASKVYRHAKGAIRKNSATFFGLHHDVLESWLHSLAFARNVCAHNGRVWNRKYTIRPIIPKMYATDWPQTSAARAFSICAMIHHMLSRIDPKSDWSTDLRNLLSEMPDVALSDLGFPADWESRSMWGFGR